MNAKNDKNGKKDNHEKEAREQEAAAARNKRDREHENSIANRDLHYPPRAEAGSYPMKPEDLMTEQEKDTSSEMPGVGPATAAAHTSGPVETIEDQGIGPRTPYPTGDPAGTREETTYSQAVKGDAPDEGKTKVAPGKTTTTVKDPTK